MSITSQDQSHKKHVQQKETSTNYLSVTDLKWNKHVNNITGSVTQKHVQQKETSTNYLSVTDLKCNKHVNNITASVTQKTCTAERNIYKLSQCDRLEIEQTCQ